MSGGTVMELGEKALETIGAYVKENLEKWMREKALNPSETRATQAGVPGAVPAPDPYRALPDSVLLERLIRIEEELKAQRNLMEVRFDAVDKRFESVDKRFEDLVHNMDRRFEAVDKRFSGIQWVMGLGFSLMAGLLAVFNFF